MGVYAVSSLFSGSAANWDQLETILEDHMPVASFSASHTSLQSTNSTSFATITGHTVSVTGLDGDERIVVNMNMAISGGNTGDSWRLRLDFGGSYSDEIEFEPAAAVTDGKHVHLGWSHNFDNDASGSVTYNLQWKANAAPTDSVYSIQGRSEILVLKRR